METTPKIMVVDDEKLICQNMEKVLSKSNYEVSYAISAEEAMEKMAREAYSLLISDVVMPGMNGLEFLKLVKDQWPLTKVMMITAYASTDTALKAMRLGAVDYIPKPFTPDELRSKVERALAGELVEASTTEKEREAIDITVEVSAAEKEEKEREGVDIIDVDMPFDRDEVAKYTGEEYARMLGPSDMPVVEMPAPEPLENFCEVGGKVCKIFKKLMHTCKAGAKTAECPEKKARKKKAARIEKAFDAKRLIGIDHPFNYEEVVSITGPEYVQNLHRDGISFIPYEELKSYEELKKDVARLMEKEPEPVPIYPEVVQEPAYKDILVIDDEVAISNNIRKILSKKGYHVDQAVTKNEAFQKIEETAYKVVLLDLKIPEVRGLELMEAIRDKDPDTSVIIITGYASIESAVETGRLGAIDYLRKPFTPDEIRDATEQAFRRAA